MDVIPDSDGANEQKFGGILRAETLGQMEQDHNLPPQLAKISDLINGIVL